MTNLTNETELKDEVIMTPHRAVMIAEGVFDAVDEDEYLSAWQCLHDTKLAYQLQGWFGREASRLIQLGLIQS
jgi:hypothetical protein